MNERMKQKSIVFFETWRSVGEMLSRICGCSYRIALMADKSRDRETTTAVEVIMFVRYDDAGWRRRQDFRRF